MMHTTGKIIMYVLSVILPIAILLIELKGILFSEILYLGLARICLLFHSNKQAKVFLINLVNKYPQNARGHK